MVHTTVAAIGIALGCHWCPHLSENSSCRQDKEGTLASRARIKGFWTNAAVKMNKMIGHGDSCLESIWDSEAENVSCIQGLPRLKTSSRLFWAIESDPITNEQSNKHKKSLIQNFICFSP